jgi:Arc/MetJ family transcription regulator
MRTNIEIDDELMRKAMAACGATTKKATVETALEEMVWHALLKEVRANRGPDTFWEGYDPEAGDEPVDGEME